MIVNNNEKIELKENEIFSVTQHIYDNIPYCYTVIIKGKIETIKYINIDSNGESVVEYYDFERLPKAVRNFLINTPTAYVAEEWVEEEDENHLYKIYTFRIL